MRQLLTWASLKVTKDMEAQSLDDKLFADGIFTVTDCLVQGLVSNAVNTSWYQRPAQTSATNASVLVSISPNPVNQVNAQCLSLMLQYQERYPFPFFSPRLQGEITQWKEATLGLAQSKQNHQSILVDTSIALQAEPNELDAEDKIILNEIYKPSEYEKDLHDCSEWIATAPLFVPTTLSLFLIFSFSHFLIFSLSFIGRSI